MSCVMKIIEIPSSHFNRLSKFITWACTLTSSAEVGSSKTSKDGFIERAIAMAARCFMPPLSSCG